MFDTADLSYILPTHRITVYLMGVYTAYILKTTSKVATFSKAQIAILWFLALVIGFSAMIGPFHMAVKAYTYSTLDGALYCALSPIFWGIGVGWTIYTSNRGYGGEAFRIKTNKHELFSLIIFIQVGSAISCLGKDSKCLQKFPMQFTWCSFLCFSITSVLHDILTNINQECW